MRVAGACLLDLQSPINNALSAIDSDDPHRSPIDRVPCRLLRPGRKWPALALDRKNPTVVPSPTEVINSLGVKAGVDDASCNRKRDAVLVRPPPIEILIQHAPDVRCAR